MNGIEFHFADDSGASYFSSAALVTISLDAQTGQPSQGDSERAVSNPYRRKPAGQSVTGINLR